MKFCCDSLDVGTYAVNTSFKKKGNYSGLQCLILQGYLSMLQSLMGVQSRGSG